MIKSDIIISAARGWIGTPYVHQASARGAGTDCLGLIRGVWREVYGAEPCAVPAYTPDWSETGGREELMAAGLAHCAIVQDADPAPGDLLLFRMRAGAVAKHLGILTEAGPASRFVHAYSGHAVVETAFSEPWRRRLAAIFRFPQEG